ncbi:MAG TPA: tRNA preQ1(34) S-adenosylmethionine ribosyltransferase-isomerase QueA [Pyrinomonadaceae bacterium]|nr:tRNA preQ1(34) S-adenosylmethionine ribosyltransferase-isomerase QueA [Pyrinomonadaceae bacterium]
MQISDFDYELPDALIAQHPLVERDAARMLIVDRATESCRDSRFTTLPDNLSEKDVLVLNDTRVFPARLRGRRKRSGGAIELLLLREIELNVWEALTRPARRLRIGSEIEFENGDLLGEVIDTRDDGIRLVRFTSAEPLDVVIDRIGEPPLPPYIKRDAQQVNEDRDRYQTIYANQRGSIAAPTAGLHFTPAVLNSVAERGVRIARLTLHVGYGTFEPVRVRNIWEHRVAAEWFSITEQAAALINETRHRGGRVVAIGTTTARALESAGTSTGEVKAQSGLAALTIFPGYKFQVVDGLLTNFHLPRSSLLVLVCAFGGREFMLQSYRHAVAERYRFYSYGDCMFIL